MPIYATFVMGKKESYFFNTPTHWAWHNLPADIEALFTKTPAIKDVIELALGDNGTYFISYRDHDNQVLAKHYNLPNALTSYLYQSQPTIIRDLSTLSISLGNFDAYYAWDKTSASWSNLPPKLEKSILNRLETQDAFKTTWKANGAEAPSFVSLGADEAYWMRTVSGGGCWDLKTAGGETFEGMRGMNKFLEDSSDFSGIAGLHLFPSHGNAYILVTTTGQSYSNLPECTWVDYNKMSSAFPATVQSMLPIPPIPQQRQPAPPPQPQLQAQPQTGVQPYQNMYAQPAYQQFQPQPQTLSAQHNCCPSNTPGAPHNCCPQAPMQLRPYGLPATNPNVVQQGYYQGPAPGQQAGYANGAYAGGQMYR